MQKLLLKSPCFTCAKLGKSKFDCAPDCEKLKSYQQNLRFSIYEDLKGSAFEMYIPDLGVRHGRRVSASE